LIKNFTGISSPYEAPEAPEFHLLTERLTSAQAAQTIVDGLAALFEPNAPEDYVI
jgi:adenylylsulfate kinase-like enzyme